MTPAGRRAGNPDTRTEILEAARDEFGESGYRRATIRGIARRASVDPALIHHYFGTKDELFAASIALPFAPGDLMDGVFEGGRDGAGRRLARAFFTIWETEQARASLLGVLRTAISGDERATAAFREFLLEALRDHLAAHIDGDDARLRAVTVASHLVGMAITRYVVRLEPVASASIDDLVDLVAPRLQSYLDQA
ncbi:MAG: TetR family transcriptional regulator [Acidimicrobiia bacterium]|nr:TetR family transcriptional regulator [Acidimicrobiia bacterium]